LLSIKTRLQIAGSSLSFQQPLDSDVTLNNIVRREGVKALFSGFIPFVLLNLFAGFHFYGLLSDEKKTAILDHVVKEAPPKGNTH